MGKAGSAGQFVLRADVIPELTATVGVVRSIDNTTVSPLGSVHGFEWDVDRALRGERRAQCDEQNDGSKALHDGIMN